MAKSSFMSMRWLREHLKEIIWGTIILFVLSIFVIGYGTSRAAKQQEKRKKDFDDAERRTRQAEEAPPAHLAGVLDQPALTISYPLGAASASQKILFVKDLYPQLLASKEYRQLMNFPPNLRQAFGGQIKERLITQLIDNNLIELYAKVNKIQPLDTEETLVAKDRQRLTPAEFDRQLRQQGLSEKEYGRQRLSQETMMALFRRIVAPIPPEKATPDYLKEYYETNANRFRLDDQVSFKHLIINPSQFTELPEIDDQEIKRYYEVNSKDFMTGPRVAVKHIRIDPSAPAFRQSMDVRKAEIQERYTEKLDTFQIPEKVKARHILIKPVNNFDQALTHFSVNIRDFKLETEATASPSHSVYSFQLALSDMKSGINFGYGDIHLVTKDGARFTPTPESQGSQTPALELPVTGGPAKTAQGRVAIILPENAEPKTLELHDLTRIQLFDVTGAHDEEASFLAAETQAKKILEKINAGEDFAALAKAHSQDDGSKEKGGDLGEFARGQMVKPFEDAAFAAQIGKTVGPVRSQFGQHLIQVEAKIPGRIKPLDEVETEIRTSILEEKAVMQAQHTLELARDNVVNTIKTFDDLIKEHKGQRLPVIFKGAIDEAYDDAEQSLLNATIGNQGEIDSAIQDALFALKKGDLSPVIQAGNGFHLFLVEEVLDSVPRKLTKALKKEIWGRVEKERQWAMAKAKAEDLAKQLTPETFEQLASGTSAKPDVTFGPLPISENPGFADYSLTAGVEQFSENGLTYLPEVHESLTKVLYPKPVPAAQVNRIALWKDKVLGPIKSRLGYHFILVTAFDYDRRESFDELKDTLRNMLTQAPTEKAINESFQEGKARFDRPQRVKIRQMLIGDEVVANQVYQRLQQGEIFDLLARQFSMSGSRGEEGMTGEFTRGQLPPGLEDEVWSLKPGEFTKPNRTSYGFVISLLEGIIPAKEATLDDDVKKKIKTELQRKYQEELLVSFMKGLRNQAFILRHEEALAAL